MSDCERIEPAMKGLTEHSKPQEAMALAKIMIELGSSHILNSDFYKQAPETARELESKGLYLKSYMKETPATVAEYEVISHDVPSNVPGASASLQQQNGIANALSLKEGERSEVLRLDARNPVLTPTLDHVVLECSGKPITLWSHFVLGKPVPTAVEISGLGIDLDAQGQPTRIRPGLKF